MERCDHVRKRFSGEQQCNRPAHVDGLHTYQELAKVSPARSPLNRAYSELRVVFLEANPWCSFPAGCGEAATEVHHRRGRVGPLLLDTDHWSGLCTPHHQYVTEHPAEAYELGISEKRLGAA